MVCGTTYTYLSEESQLDVSLSNAFKTRALASAKSFAKQRALAVTNDK
jgi:hypothetical protein